MKRSSGIFLALLVAALSLLSVNASVFTDSAHLVLSLFQKKSRSPAEHPAEAIEVIGAGFGRTGTESLKTALDILGYKTYHMDQVFGFHEKFVMNAFNGGEKEYKAWFNDMLRHGYTATTDFPTCSFYKEQMKEFPNAKVVLTTRPAEKWVTSVESLMWNVGSTFLARPFVWLVDNARFMENSIGSRNASHAVPNCVPVEDDFEFFQPWYMPWIKVPIGMNFNKQGCIDHYNAHLAEVEKVVPKEKLLAMSVTEGWEPLCRHLKKPVPDQPFPRTNGSDGLAMMRSMLMFVAYTYPFLIMGVLMVARFVVMKVASLVAGGKQKTE